MKKSRLFLATGALVLAVSAIFATKANKKFTGGFRTGFSKIDHSFSIKTLSDGIWLTVTATSHKAAIVTVFTANSFAIRTQLVTGTAFTHLLYY